MPYLLIVAGVVVLVLGAQALVRGGVGLARRFGVSQLLIGVTVVAFGTSAPELVIALDAARGGLPDLVIGNAIGSNICNVLLVLGATALVAPIAASPHALRRDGAVMAFATLLVVALALGWGGIERWHGAGLLAILVLASWNTYRAERVAWTAPGAFHRREAEQVAPVTGSVSVNGCLVVVGIAMLYGGAELLVAGAVDTARAFGVSETVIGLSLVAAGTSLPELATSVVAARRGSTDVALGNVLGSNVFNLLGVLGAATLIAPIPFPPRVLAIDLWLLIASAAVLTPAIAFGRPIGRCFGLALLGAYAAYVTTLYTLAD